MATASVPVTTLNTPGGSQPFGQCRQRQCGQRRFRGRFQHHGAASGQCRGYLARDHGVGEIPRRDGRHHAHALAHGEQALVAKGLGITSP
jgi:hypothetical protein